MARTKRIYICKVCGWKSRSFGSHSRIDPTLREEAYREAKKHLEECHGLELRFPETMRVEVE